MTLRSLAIGLQSIHMHPTGVDATGNERIRYYIQINDAYVVGCTLLRKATGLQHCLVSNRCLPGTHSTYLIRILVSIWCSHALLQPFLLVLLRSTILTCASPFSHSYLCFSVQPFLLVLLHSTILTCASPD